MTRTERINLIRRLCTPHDDGSPRLSPAPEDVLWLCDELTKRDAAIEFQAMFDEARQREEGKQSDPAEIATLHNEIERLLDEIDRLRAIVEKLPTTADGVPVTDGMLLYPSDESHIVDCHAKTDAYWVTSNGQHIVDGVERFYSSREAAKAAKEKP